MVFQLFPIGEVWGRKGYRDVVCAFSVDAVVEMVMIEEQKALRWEMGSDGRGGLEGEQTAATAVATLRLASAPSPAIPFEDADCVRLP